MKKYFTEIYSLLGEDKQKLPLLASVFLIVSTLDMLSIGLIGPYVSLLTDSSSISSGLQVVIKFFGFPEEKKELLRGLGFVLIAIFFLKMLSVIYVNNIIIRFSQHQDVRLRSYLMRSYQSLPYALYQTRNSSEYVDICQRIVSQYTKGVLVGLLRMFSDGVVTIAIIGLLLWSNSMAVFLLIVLLGGFTFVYDRGFRRRLKYHGVRANQEAKNMLQSLTEGIEGLKEIRIIGKERYFYRKVHDSAKSFARHQSVALLLSLMPRYLLEFVFMVFFILFVFVIIGLEQDLNVLLPTLSMMAVAALRLLPAASNASTTLTQLRYNRDAVALLYKDFVRLKDQDFVRKKIIVPPKRKNSFISLVVDNIDYSYPECGSKSLSNLSLEFTRGESIGLIGTSGSGKSTLVDVILGLLEPQNGSVRYNGKPINQFRAEWNLQVAYLPQVVFLIDNTLKKNIALGVEDDEIDPLLIIKSIKQARLSELVDKLPDGINSVIGERGVRLSGGQRQRVALARAFYHGRNVLIMDEATSALDNETEEEIVKEIRQLKGKRTVLVVAHRLSTLRYCDRIYRIEKGRVVDSGPPGKMLSID